MIRPRLMIPMVLLLAVAGQAQDVITVGSASGDRGDVVEVPVSIRDANSTTLDADSGPSGRIQAIGFKVTYAPAESVASISFERAGVMQTVTPRYEQTILSEGGLAWVGSFDASEQTIPFTLDRAAPGDQIGTLIIEISSTAPAGSAIHLTIHPATAILSNDAGTSGETVANGGLALVNGMIAINELPPFGVPGSVKADAVSTTQINVSWSEVTGAAQYEVWRSSHGEAFALAGSSPGMFFSDTGRSSGVTYLYTVRAVSGTGTFSDYSAADPATTIVFEEDPLIATVTLVRSTHLLQARAAVNAFRDAADLAPATFTGTGAAGTTALAAHIVELRNALNEAVDDLGLPGLTYSETPIAPGVTIKAAHFQEIRNAVK